MDGRRLKFLNILDEYSRVCLAIRVSRRCKAVDVILPCWVIEHLCGQAAYRQQQANWPYLQRH